MPRQLAWLAAFAAAAHLPTATAHVTLERAQAPADSHYKAILQVPHGCKGSPTVAVRVRIPEGAQNVKPQPKPGWKLAITRVKLDKPVDAGHGNFVSERVSEIAWTDGELADEHFDEFRITMKLPDRPGTALYLPVVQECRQGVTRWIEIPEGGKPAAELHEPAPALQLLPRP